MSAFLLGDLIFAVFWTVLIVLLPKQRKIQIFGSLLLLPFGVLDIWFRKAYWHPPILVGSIAPLSIETFLYCFFAGGIAAVLGAMVIKKHHKTIRVSVLNLALFLLAAFSLYAIFESIPAVNSMNALSFAFSIIWLILLASNPKRNIVSLIPAVLVALFTIIAVNTGLVFFPGFVENYWNLNSMWPQFLKTPTEEIYFAAILAALWTVIPDHFIQNDDVS